MQYIIYCDESEKKGPYFGNFYGGALVRSADFQYIVDILNAKKEVLNLTSEVKWTKVTEKYLDKYVELIDTFFDFIEQNKVKIRIMFTHNKNSPLELTNTQKDEEFFILYYQFLKHAFGLQFSNPTVEPISLFIYFDQLPDKEERNKRFKDFIYNLQFIEGFSEANLFFHSLDDIAEAESHKHVILQCLDVILGSIEFRLNEKHKCKPEGQRLRGKRTRAKEKLYKHINARIRRIYPNFNVGESTGIAKGLADRWDHPYRHWKFTSKRSAENQRYVPKNGKQK